LSDDGGYSIGPGVEEDLQGFVLNVHCNTPELNEGKRVNGGLRVYYSLSPRMQELLVMMMGDGRTHLKGIPLERGVTDLGFECQSECSRIALLGEPITVVGEIFHMHQTGVKGMFVATGTLSAAIIHGMVGSFLLLIPFTTVQQQIRNVKVICQSQVNFFDFDQDVSYMVHAKNLSKSSLVILFETSVIIVHETTALSLGSHLRKEMCQGDMIYYNTAS